MNTDTWARQMRGVGVGGGEKQIRELQWLTEYWNLDFNNDFRSVDDQSGSD